MNRQSYDIETLADCSTFTFQNYDTKEQKQFVFWKNRNDWKALKEFWKTITHLISFNGNHFDNPVTMWILDEHRVNRFMANTLEHPSLHQWVNLADLTGDQLAKLVYHRAQTIITRSEEDDIRKEIYQLQRQTSFTSIDVFLFWSKMLRLSKKLSLKFFAHNLGMNIVEMPIHHTRKDLTEEELDQVLSYNANDVDVTGNLALELRELINLRAWIKQTYGLECFSKDAPKVAQEIILKFYCEKTGRNPKELSRRRYIKPERLYLKDWLPQIDFKTPFFQQIYSDMQGSVNGFKREYLYKNPDGTYVKLSYGIGGLHSLNDNERWLSTKDKLLITSDVGSLYPTLIINNGYVSPELGAELLDVYKQIRTERLAAKKAKEKQKDLFLKLCLNGFSGLADSPTCWLYAPEQILMMRMHGQLLLSRLIEECYLSKINIISVNTDGLELHLKPEELDGYYQILSRIQQEFNVEFDTDQYQAIYYKTVNDYLAITTSGKVKMKGEFVCGQEPEDKTISYKDWKPILDASNEFLVIPKAITAYFKDKILPDKFIRSHPHLIDFTAAKKVDKKFTIWYRGEKQQSLNRYLVSTKSAGAYLYKQKEKGKLENVLKDIPVLLVNEACTKPAQSYPIDYQFYVRKTWETIRLFERTQLDLFSTPDLFNQVA